MLKALFYPDVKFETLYIPYIYKEIYLEGVYKDVMNSFIGHDDKIIVDIGANIGCTVQYFRDYGKVYAVEPSPEHFEALKYNKDYNHWDNVKIFQVAIADKDGEMTLHQHNGNRACHSLINDYGQGGEKVKTQTLETFFKENKLETVDFMKFDVEGAEESILCAPEFSDVAPMIKSMMIEFHFPNFPTIINHLIALGFKCKRYPSSAIIFLCEK